MVVSALLFGCVGGQPPTDSSGSTAASSQAVPSERAIVMLRPGASGFELPIGRFGPCSLTHDQQTRVSTLFCDKSGTENDEGILFNFYVPGVWAKEAFSAESIALQFRSSLSPDELVFSFAAPEHPGGELRYHIYSMKEYAEKATGQAWITRVARLRDGVYAMSYSRVFYGPPESMREQIRTWLRDNLSAYSTALDAVQLDDGWLDYVKSQ
jgi:hypothetical protein